jgi:hypothetical protein
MLRSCKRFGDFLRAHNDTIVEKKKLDAQMKQSIQNQKDKQWRLLKNLKKY